MAVAVAFMVGAFWAWALMGAASAAVEATMAIRLFVSM
jgi:hypothetical protein